MRIDDQIRTAAHRGSQAVLAAARRRAWVPVRAARWLGACGASVVMFGVLTTAAASAASPEPAVRDARDAAIQSIPFHELTDETQAKLWNVISKSTLHRRLPIQTIDCDPDLYLFFVRKPEVVVNMWQLMGISTLTMKRTGAYTMDALDGSGTQSKVELIYGTPETHVLYGEGVYEGPLFKRQLSGRCVMVLKSDYNKTPLQRTNISSQMDVFLTLDNVGADLMAKTLQPVLGKTADQNFAETAGFVSRVSHAIEKNSSGVPRLAARMSHVQPEVRTEFVRVATLVSQKHLPPPPGVTFLPREEEVARANEEGGLPRPAKNSTNNGDAASQTLPGTRR